MKTVTTKLLLILAAVAIVTGCATDSSKTKPPVDSNAWKKANDLQVWLAPGFDFNGYDAIYIDQTKFVARERSNEVDIRNWAMKYLRSQFAAEISRVRIVPAVYTETNDIPAGTKLLTLDDTITEYEKGGGAVRYFTHNSGGQPVIRVRGVMTANGQPVFRFEGKRSGQSGTAIMFGGFRSDEGIQTEDINDLAIDLADYMSSTSKHRSK